MEALKAIKIIGNQNDGKAVFISSKYRVTKGLNFMRDPKQAHILVLNINVAKICHFESCFVGGGQRHFWHFLPVIPNFWQVPNFLRCQKCRKCQTFKKSPSILCTIDSLAHLTHIWECSRDLYRVFTNVSQIYVLRLQMQLISHYIEADLSAHRHLFC